jgi:hypothetical protein
VETVEGVGPDGTAAAGEGVARKPRAGHAAFNSAEASRRLLVFVNHPALTYSQQLIMQVDEAALTTDPFFNIQNSLVLTPPGPAR